MILPLIAIDHLRQVVIAGTGGPIIGFHILPAGVVVSSSSPVLLPAAGTRLKRIATAMPQSGQFLNVSHRP